MHASEDVRIVKCLDGLHYSFEILQQAYSDLYPTCQKIKNDPGALPAALWRAWSVVDAVHRIREITQGIRGLSGSNQQLKDFLGATAVAEDLRHYIQHLRKGLGKKDVNPYPVWGTLSWVDPEVPIVSYTVLSGARVNITHFPGAVYDKLHRQWASKVCLSADGKSFNFDPVYQACMTFRDFILSWILSTFKPGIQVTTKPPVFKAAIGTRSELVRLGLLKKNEEGEPGPTESETVEAPPSTEPPSPSPSGPEQQLPSSPSTPD
jgi:hypothetical protein